MVPDESKTGLGMEYFCNQGDALWQMADDALIDLAAKEMEMLGLAAAKDVIDGVVIRQEKAYPVYDGTYRQHLSVIQEYLATFDNLQTIGRNGMHRYNNQDHSMLTGLLAVQNILGATHNLWDVNTERSYYEEFTKDDATAKQSMSTDTRHHRNVDSPALPPVDVGRHPNPTAEATERVRASTV